MAPIRTEHSLSRRKGSSLANITSTGADGDERSKQPRRTVGVPRRHSPSHSRTPSPNQQVVPSASGIQIHTASHGHVFAHGTRRSPSSKAANPGSSRSVFPESVNGSREKRRASPDPARKGYAHAHASRSLGSKSPAFGPPLKGPSLRGPNGPAWGVSSPGASVAVGSRGISSPPPPPSNSGRGHLSPTLGRESRGDGNDGQAQPLQPPGHSVTSGPPLPCAPTSCVVSAGSATEGAEAREMTPLDRVFLEQPHEGRQDVEDDDLHLCNEIQRHLQSRVQSQLMEATNRNASGANIAANGGGNGVGGRGSTGGGSSVSSARSRAINLGSGNGSNGVGGHPNQNKGVSDSFAGQEMELIDEDDGYHRDSVHDDPGSDADDFVNAAPRRGPQPGNGYSNSPISMTIGGTDLLDDPDLGSAGLPPVSPSSGGGPAQGLVLDVGSSMEFLLDPDDQCGGARDTRDTRAAPGLRSPLGSTLTTDVQMSEAGDGQLRNVVSGLDAMDLDDVDRALALLTAQKERIIAKQHAGAAAAAAQAEAEAQAEAQAAVLVPPQPPPAPAISINGGSTSSNRAGGGGRQRRSSGRSRHGGESSPSAGGRAEAFGVSGGGVRGAPAPLLRVARGQGRPPPVPGHMSASTAAMRRSSPANIASLAELDSYLEHHHRRLVEQVEGGVVADDVEAEIRASRHPRRGTRSHHRLGSSGSNGLGSSSSSSGVPRTVGARVSTGSFFHSTLSADGDFYRDWGAKNGRSSFRGHSLSGAKDHELDLPLRGPGYKRDRGEQCGGSDSGLGPSFGDFRREGRDRDGPGFMGVSGSTQTHSQTSSPPSIMSDDVSVSSFGHPVMVLPTSPNNVTFAGRPPPSLSRIRLEAVRSPAVRQRQMGRGVEDGPVFTSPDASKHVQELCSPRSAFTPRSASSVSSLASSPARQR